MNPVSTAQRMQAGKALRKKVPRGAVRVDRKRRPARSGRSHRRLEPGPDSRAHSHSLRTDGAQSLHVLARIGGAMAYDLAGTPATGVQVQACGDCQLLNFGLFATPERNLIFDLNDFDETLHAPWEWDLKRLAASFVVAGRVNGVSDRCLRDVAAICARSYRQHLREFSR